MFERCIQAGPRPTRVVVEPGVLGQVGAHLVLGLQARPPAAIVVLTDETVGSLYAASVIGSLSSAGHGALHLQVPPGEQSKSLEQAGNVYRFLADHAVPRDAIMIALGGGVVSDLAGFVAATWMRGIRWVICPTSLEAQVDAAIGGKTAINIPGAKNLVGAFHHPDLVLIDPACLQTLPDREYVAGLAESAKHAAVFSLEFFEWHEHNAEAIARCEQPALAELIRRNVEIKSSVVERDPVETTGERVLLNFGHTIGHGIEEACGYRLRHGECVALGMVAACRISRDVAGLAEKESVRIRDLLHGLRLPVRLDEPIDSELVLQAIRRDKKASSRGLRFVLLKAIGCPVICADVPEPSVRAALTDLQRQGMA